MDKNTVITHFGNANRLAKALDYAHRNVCYGWPDPLTHRIFADVIRRMKANRIKIPAEWKNEKL